MISEMKLLLEALEEERAEWMDVAKTTEVSNGTLVALVAGSVVGGLHKRLTAKLRAAEQRTFGWQDMSDINWPPEVDTDAAGV